MMLTILIESLDVYTTTREGSEESKSKYNEEFQIDMCRRVQCLVYNLRF